MANDRKYDLAGLSAELTENTSAIVAACAGLSDEQLAWRPDPKSWSIAEVLVHLRVTADLFLPALDRAAEDARRRKQLAPGPFALNRWGRLLVWYVEPPPKLRLPAPPPLRPLLEGSPSAALAAFLEAQARTDQRFAALEGIDLNAATVVSPIAGYIRMSALAFVLVLISHERRHLVQIGKLRRGVVGELPGPR